MNSGDIQHNKKQGSRGLRSRLAAWRGVLRGLRRSTSFALISLFAGFSVVLANQVPIGSFNSTSFVIKQYPGGSTGSEARYNLLATSDFGISAPRVPLNSVGGVTAA